MRDIRHTPLYQEAEALYGAMRVPGTGQVSDAAEIHASPDGRHAVFSGSLLDALQGTPLTRICRIDLGSGELRVLTFGPHCDRAPKFAPDARLVAFLSDRKITGDFQLYLLDPITGMSRSAPAVDGWVEYLQWSPDGRRILLGVAGRGADVSGAQGAMSSRQVSQDLPSWMPSVETGNERYRWRSVWVYELATNTVRRIAVTGLNVWEATWCGGRMLAVAASTGPAEGHWYGARLHLVDVESGNARELYVPRDQLGTPATSPSGNSLAIVEAICSDRCVVAGDLRIIDTSSGAVRPIDTSGVDISHAEWRDERHLLVAGHRGLETVVGLCDVATGALRETWMSRDLSTGGFYAAVSGLPALGDCVLLGESFVRAPEIAAIRDGGYHVIRSLQADDAAHASVLYSDEGVTWTAPDGLSIQGRVLEPHGPRPHPLVMILHGGPVWHWRPVWLGRGRAFALMLLKRGYAIFLPNPRGSSGRGRSFVEKVLGDIGGADRDDCLSGLNHLVAEGIADPRRLGVTGGSYGGFMTSWLITQDTRFAAAVVVAPHTNQVTEYLLSNIPHFMSLFLGGRYDDPAGKHFERSPVMHAHNVRTPTLNVCGALDRCTPPEEARQFHSALFLESDAESVLVCYPQEGHGIRSFPAAIDFAARMVGWFEEHMGHARSRDDGSHDAEPFPHSSS